MRTFFARLTWAGVNAAATRETLAVISPDAGEAPDAMPRGISIGPLSLLSILRVVTSSSIYET